MKAHPPSNVKAGQGRPAGRRRPTSPSHSSSRNNIRIIFRSFTRRRSWEGIKGGIGEVPDLGEYWSLIELNTGVLEIVADLRCSGKEGLE